MFQAKLNDFWLVFVGTSVKSTLFLKLAYSVELVLIIFNLFNIFFWLTVKEPANIRQKTPVRYLIKFYLVT